LTGPGSNLKKIEEFFASKINLPVVHADLLQKFKIDKSAEEVLKKTGSGDYEISLGLSLKGLI
jgi:Tfp pilus assembly PilM family ATPase